MPKVFLYFLTVFLISAFLVSLTIINFWLFAMGFPELIYASIVVFSVVLFFAGSYIFAKVNNAKKESAGLARLLEKNEKKLRNSETEKYRVFEIFANIAEGILVVDENEKVSIINSKAKKILAVKEKDIKGMPIAELRRLPDIKPILPYLLSLTGVFKEEVNFKNFIIEVSVTQLVFSGSSMGRLIVLRDITREKLLEKEKNDFIISIAHQIKTAISSAKWSLKMFLDGDFGQTNKEQADVIKRLYKINDSSFFLIESLLDATKIEDGVYTYNKTLADIQDIVQGMMNYFQDKIKDKNIKVKFKKPANRLEKLMLDKAKIESVVLNLFDNALKYTKTGGVIEVSLEKKGDNIEFKIKDSGIGIPKDQQAKIFKKFFRAENANKIESTGTGLGLFIAKKIIEGHGGRLWFESEEDKGSAFYFTLPTKDVK